MSRKYTQAQNRATQKYIKNAYDTITVRVFKGEKDKIKEHADNISESVNGFICRAINETMERDKEGQI